MFGFLKRKARKIYAPVEGKVFALEEVNDEVFSQKMAGDGVAILPSVGTFTAPIEGIVSKLFPTHHAYCIKDKKGFEVMIHIGLDTVSLAGKGFSAKVKEGDRVTVGDTIIEADLALIAAAQRELTTMVLLLPTDDYKEIKKSYTKVKNGETIMEVQ